MKKLPYEAPKLTVVGTFESVTQASSNGSRFDAFVVGTPGQPTSTNLFS